MRGTEGTGKEEGGGESERQQEVREKDRRGYGYWSTFKMRPTLTVLLSKGITQIHPPSKQWCMVPDEEAD